MSVTIQTYMQTLNKSILICLSNLRYFDNYSTDFFEIMEHLPHTIFNVYLDYFNASKDYFLNNNHFPDFEYLQTLPYNANLLVKQSVDISESIVLNLKKGLRYESIISRSNTALLEKDLDKANSILSELATATTNVDEVYYDRTKYFDDYIERSKHHVGIMTGIKELDDITKGLYKPSLVVISAPAGSGKTTSAVSIVYDAVVHQGKNFAYITFEIQSEQIESSFLSRHSFEMSTSFGSNVKIKSSDLKRYVSHPDFINKLKLVKQDFDSRVDGKLYIVSQSNFEKFDAVALIKKLKQIDDECRLRGEKLDGFVFDYIQLTKFYKPQGIKDEKETMNFYVRQFQSICNTFNNEGLVGIILAQTNRAGSEALKKNKDASLFSFAEANELERSAYYGIIFYASDDMKLSGLCNFYLVKHRIGETKSTPTPFSVNFGYFKFGTNNQKLLPLISGLELQNDFVPNKLDDNFDILNDNTPIENTIKIEPIKELLVKKIDVKDLENLDFDDLDSLGL